MSDGPALLFYMLLLILPVTALIVRRVRPIAVLKIGLIWIAIFGIGTLILYAIN